ncbi:MAG TPA: helix-turn-helix transcriptional regulator [Candidatus Limnocylindrales bacterium]|nr:helix-turn-helix transcriptional regulator [Candidatus Limnocylindrales bacterium]
MAEPMLRTSRRTAVGRAAADLRRRVGLEIRRLRIDAGLSIRALAAATGVSHGHLARIESGEHEASYATLIAIGNVLGADVAVHLYPTTGPSIHDRFQAPMMEALFQCLDERWRRLPEVAVYRPSRGFIDGVLADPTSRLVIATECQSEIRRLEQELRWASDKAESLPSSSLWRVIAPADEPSPTISRLLVLRSTASTRAVAREFGALLGAAYPARSCDAFRALTTGDGSWPGPAILWATVASGSARILERPPRGIDVGH